MMWAWLCVGTCAARAADVRLPAAVPVALAVAAAQPVMASAAARPAALTTMARRFLSMIETPFLQVCVLGVAAAELDRTEHEQDRRVAGEHRELAPGREHVLHRPALGRGHHVE